MSLTTKSRSCPPRISTTVGRNSKLRTPTGTNFRRGISPTTFLIPMTGIFWPNTSRMTCLLGVVTQAEADAQELGDGDFYVCTRISVLRAPKSFTLVTVSDKIPKSKSKVNVVICKGEPCAFLKFLGDSLHV